jgi:dTDP-4-dehydrorhamnose reductase
MNIFTIGAGFVSDHLNYQKIENRLDTSSKQIEAVLDRYKPDVLINCIGKTGRPNVDWCEANKEITAATNTALPILLAEACAKKSIHLIQIGSGCIYFGESPNFHYLQGDGTPWPDRKEGVFVIPAIKVDDGWREEDFANPKSFYSKTKYACDLMLGSMKHVTTLRIRMPISNKNNQRNLINKLRGYKQVIDIPNSVTFMDDLANCIDWAAKGTHTGIFHVTNPEPLTAAQVMREYQKYVPDHTFEIITEAQLDKLTLAKRSNCILNADKLKNAGFTMSPTKEALEKCMADYVKTI